MSQPLGVLDTSAWNLIPSQSRPGVPARYDAATAANWRGIIWWEAGTSIVSWRCAHFSFNQSSKHNNQKALGGALSRTTVSDRDQIAAFELDSVN